MKLTVGQGSPEQGGCWMVAVQRYTEEHQLLPLILELCAMSTPAELVPVRSAEQVLREVCLVAP